MNAQLNSTNFWDTDLTEIDQIILGKGKRITDLPTALDNRVPSQGSVLLANSTNLDSYCIKVSAWDRIKHAFISIF